MFPVNAHYPLGCHTHRNVSIQRQAFRGTASAAHAVLPVLLARPMQCQRVADGTFAWPTSSRWNKRSRPTQCRRSADVVADVVPMPWPTAGQSLSVGHRRLADVGYRSCQRRCCIGCPSARRHANVQFDVGMLFCRRRRDGGPISPYINCQPSADVGTA